MAAKQPELDAFAEQLIGEALTWARDLTDERMRTLGEVQPGSRTADDDAATAPHHLSHAAVSCLQAARDHLRTIDDVIRDPGLRPAPPYTLCRAAIENAATSLWLLTPDDQVDRIRRRLHLTLDDLRDREEMETGMGHTMTPSFEERRLEVVEIAARAAIPAHAVSGKTASWRTILRGADEAIEGKGGALTAWRMCSGFAHARLHATLGGLERVEVLDRGDGTVLLELRTSSASLGFAAHQAHQVGALAERLIDRHRRR